MASTLDKIVRILPPPNSPVRLDRSWDSVEKELGTALPTDYKQFIDLYGTGAIARELHIWNFRDASSDKSWRERLIGVGRWYDEVRDMGDHDWPYRMFPEPGGLLPFAGLMDVNHLNWLTKGTPDQWDVVLWLSDDAEFLLLKGESFTDCLLKMLQNKYNPHTVPELEPPVEFAGLPG